MARKIGKKAAMVARATALTLVPSTKMVRCSAIIDIVNQPQAVQFSHVDYTEQQLATNNPQASYTQANTFSTKFWGCKQFADLYQYFTMAGFTYQWVPSVAFTWSGTIAMKVTDDPLDNANVTTVNNFINAPSSVITAVYAPSQVTTWRPQQSKKFCYGNTAIDVNQDPIVGSLSLLPFTQARMQSYGNLNIETFGITDPTGAAPSDTVVLGRVLMTAMLMYDTPMPIGNDRNVSATIYLPKIGAVPPP
jgi:hypothetical protein